MTDELERILARPVAGSRALDLDRLRDRLAKRAAAANLLDVAYAPYDSPLGLLTIFVTERGIVRLAYPNEPIDEQLEQLAGAVSPRVLRAPQRTDDMRRQLDEYFAGTRREFEVPVDWRLIRGFAISVLRATARIPFGEVSTYRDIAAAAGSPNAFRAAGTALGSNPIPIVVPCHRVLRASGGLGGYAGGLDRKRFLLELEGLAAG